MMMEPMIPNLAVRQRSNPASASAAASVLARFVSHWQARSPLPMITPELRHLILMGCCSSRRAYRLPPDADAAAGLLLLLVLALVADDDVKEEVERARRMKLKRRHILIPSIC